MHAGGVIERPPAQDIKRGASSLVFGLASSLSLMFFCMLAHQLVQGRTKNRTSYPRESLKTSKCMPHKPKIILMCIWAGNKGYLYQAHQSQTFLHHYTHIHNCDLGQLRFRVNPKLSSNHYPGATMPWRCHLGLKLTSRTPLVILAALSAYSLTQTS